MLAHLEAVAASSGLDSCVQEGFKAPTAGGGFLTGVSFDFS